ncbi:MAG: hypothetical protein KDE53_17905, partial [Caldilineaceae bacterium]|nr:hypothetical protein [Caldilineaceae bacterium]
ARVAVRVMMLIERQISFFNAERTENTENTENITVLPLGALCDLLRALRLCVNRLVPIPKE